MSNLTERFKAQAQRIQNREGQIRPSHYLVDTIHRPILFNIPHITENKFKELVDEVEVISKTVLPIPEDLQIVIDSLPY